MVHFGLKRSILVHLGPPAVLWPLLSVEFEISVRNPCRVRISVQIPFLSDVPLLVARVIRNAIRANHSQLKPHIFI